MARPPIIKLTSKYILDNINQEDIFSVYFNIPASHISAIVNTNKKISAPYRSDKDPSFGFIYRSNGKLIGRDFGGYFWGDCFDCVGFVLGLNANIKSDFGKIMEHIIKTFRLNKYQNTASTFSYIRKEIEIKEKPVLNIQVRARGWNTQDANYWFNRYGVTRAILTEHEVVPVLYLYFNGNVVYEYDEYDPAYAYYLGKRDYIDYWKVYYPLRKKGSRFHSNGSFVQGIRQIKSADFGIITKAMKDVLVFKSNLVQAIAPPAESVFFTPTQINYIKSKWTNVFSFMDFDRTGRAMARHLRKEFDIPSIFLTNGDFNTYDFGVKDASDYRHKYGKKQSQLLFSTAFENNFEFTDEFAQLISQLKHY